jgi:hypothetical protein
VNIDVQDEQDEGRKVEEVQSLSCASCLSMFLALHSIHPRREGFRRTTCEALIMPIPKQAAEKPPASPMLLERQP